MASPGEGSFAVARGKVLVVDDAAEVADLVASTLESSGFSTQVARNGHDGVEDARSWQPDVVVLDLGVPDVDGLEVCRQIERFVGSPLAPTTT